jgi:MGT family glycosyltransferase
MLSRPVIAPLPPGFRDPEHPLPPGSTWMRPEAFMPAAGDGRLVYMTLGTIFGAESGDLYDRLLAAAGSVDADVLLTVGRDLAPPEAAVPSNVRVEGFVPQRDVLAGCGVVVCHAGSGTVVGAVANGVPLVLLPLGADQPQNARRCEALGVGRTLDARSASAAAIADAVTAMLDDARPRARARVLQASCATLPTADDVLASLVDGLGVETGGHG